MRRPGLRGKFAPVSVLKTELAAGSSDDCLTVSNSLKPKRLSDIEVSPATECAFRWALAHTPAFAFALANAGATNRRSMDR